MLLPFSVGYSQNAQRKLSMELQQIAADYSTHAENYSSVFKNYSSVFKNYNSAGKNYSCVFKNYNSAGENYSSVFKNYNSSGEQNVPHAVRALVKLQDGTPSQWLLQHGCSIISEIGRVIVADIPVENLSPLSEEAKVIRIETHRGRHLCLDTTAEHANVAKAYAGTGLPQAFTGKGVLLGISDIGFDLTHPTFYDAGGTTCRIRHFLDQSTATDESSGRATPLGTEYSGQQQILQKQHSADATTELHGTHCLGIAAGSGYNTAYRGMAYEADICAVASSTGDDTYFSANEAALLKYIFDCADSLQMPCAISYSIGFDYVPGDAVLYEEALASMLGPGHILVAAAGNENRKRKYMHKLPGQQSAGTSLRTSDNTVGIVFRIFSNSSFNLRFTSPYGNEDDEMVVQSDLLPSEPTSFFGGILRTERQDSIYTFRINTEGDNRLQALGVIIEGTDADAQLLADYYTTLINLSYIDSRLGSAESGHNVMLPATLTEVITVGAMCYQQNSSSGQYGEIANFSSQGATIDYRVKPDVTASGVDVMSAMNSFYGGGSSDTPTSLFNGKTYHWTRLSGTSMATPAVAGIVALWLQASPTLSPQQVLDVIAHTSTRPVDDVSYPNNTYGYGEIDAYSGLLYILGLSTAIPQLSTHQPKDLSIKLSGKTLTVEGADAGQLRAIDVYSLSGTRVGHAANTNTIDLSALPAGVYAVQITGNGRSLDSTLIRL